MSSHEVISRQLVLVAGLNNLLKRGDTNDFAPKLTNRGKNIAPTTLNAFADVVFGAKQDFLDDCWYKFLEGSMNNQLQNAIARNKTEYDEVTQLLISYPRKEGIAQNQSR